MTAGVAQKTAAWPLHASDFIRSGDETCDGIGKQHDPSYNPGLRIRRN
jgi:hypothetical protein